MKVLRFLLFPFAVLYGFITSLRNWCFDVGVFKTTSFDVPVIAVGNLSVGGTGKTPQIEYLIRLLKKKYKVVVLSRGYKRKLKGFIQLNETHTAEEVGDEPLQFYKKFGREITIAVDANRTNGIKRLLSSKTPPDVVLLDDAYQHRKVKAKSYILLTKYNDLYSQDFILPTGNLRESKTGAKRADFIIVTKCPEDLSLTQQQNVIKRIHPEKYQKIFFTSISYHPNLKGGGQLTIHELKDKEVLLLTGIANPEPLLKYLLKENINYTHLKFSDHHYFSAHDINKINATYNKISKDKKVILTTEKDYVRLEGKLDNLFFIGIESMFLTDSEIFDSSIEALMI